MNQNDSRDERSSAVIDAMASFAAAMIRACGFCSVQSVTAEDFARVRVNFDDVDDADAFFTCVVERNPGVFMHVEAGADSVSFVVGDFEKMVSAFHFSPFRF